MLLQLKLKNKPHYLLTVQEILYSPFPIQNHLNHFHLSILSRFRLLGFFNPADVFFFVGVAHLIK